MKKSTEAPSSPGTIILGVAASGLLLVGVASAFFGVVCLLSFEPDYQGGGLLLIASAIAFGQTLNCLLRQ